MQQRISLPLRLAIDYNILGAIQELEQSIHPEVSDALSVLKEHYAYLLDYYAKGGDDPERSRLLEEMRHSIASLCCRHAVKEIVGAGYVVPTHHLSEMEGGFSILSLTALLETAETSALWYAGLETLFDKLWQTPLLSPEETAALRYITGDGASPLLTRAIVGALYLSLSLGIDPAKYDLLLDICRSGDLGERMYALSALLLVTALREEELQGLYPTSCQKVRSLFGELSEDEVFAALNAIYSSYRTEDDHKVFIERIEPQLTQIAQQLNFFGGESLLEQFKSAEKSAEISEIEKTVLGIQEELPRDRDLSYHTVYRMKNSSFFNSIPRFFLPWDKHHPSLDLQNAEAFEKMLPLAFKSEGMVCSSDCYSFGMIDYWRQFTEMMGGHIPIDVVPTIDRSADYYAKDFVFGLYRFIKLSPWGRRFIDPFALHLDVVVGGGTAPLLDTGHRDFVHRLVDRLVALKEYDSVIHIADHFLGTHPEDTHLRRVQAVVYYRRADYAQALYSLETVERLEGISTAIAVRLGELYARIGEPQKALDIYAKAYAQDPEAQPLSTRYAHALMDDGRYGEASQILYASYFLRDGEGDVQQTLDLAQCLLMVGKADDALSRLSDVSDTEDRTVIYRAVAHILGGRRAAALEDLSRWCKLDSSRLSYVTEIFSEVCPVYGWSHRDIRLLSDSLTLLISRL